MDPGQSSLSNHNIVSNIEIPNFLLGMLKKYVFLLVLFMHPVGKLKFALELILTLFYNQPLVNLSVMQLCSYHYFHENCEFTEALQKYMVQSEILFSI